MKNQREIEDRLRNYEKNLPAIRDKTGRMVLKHAMAQLEWVLEVEGRGK